MMKKNLSKILTISTFALILIISLAGCGKNNNNYSDKNKENKNTEELPIEDILKKSDNISEISYDFVTSASQAMANNTQGGEITTTIARKGNKTKIKTNMNGIESAYYVDSDKNTAYTYLKDQNLAIKTDFEEVEKIIDDSPIKIARNFEIDNIKKLGKESIEGKKCQIIEAEAEARKVKIWIWEENGLPLKTEMDSPSGKMTIELKNIKTKVDDTEVELPEDAKIMETPNIEDMPNMMQNIDINNIPGM